MNFDFSREVVRTTFLAGAAHIGSAVAMEDFEALADEVVDGSVAECGDNNAFTRSQEGASRGGAGKRLACSGQTLDREAALIKSENAVLQLVKVVGEYSACGPFADEFRNLGP